MIIDNVKSSDKKEQIPQFDKNKNVHVNVPIGKEAKNQYGYTIRTVKSINPKSFGDVSEQDNYDAFDQTRLYLISLHEYYQGIAKVYATMDYIANDELIFEKSYECKTSSALISDEERELLSKAIETIDYKLSQMAEHVNDCFY